MARMKIDIPPSFHFTTDIPVRIGDINYGGHLGNDTLLSILQEARVQMLAQHGWSEMNVEGAGLIMTDAAVMYRAEVFYGDSLTIRIQATDFARTGCDLAYQVTNKSTGKEVARAKTGITFFNYAERKVIAMPEAFRQAFSVILPVR